MTSAFHLLKARRLCIAAAIIESGLLIFFSSLPSSSLPSTGVAVGSAGNLEHFLSYLFYGVFLLGAFAARTKKSLVLTLLAGAGMGILTEGIQLFVPTRQFDFFDWLINILGTSTGGMILLAAPTKDQKTFSSGEDNILFAPSG